MNLKRIFSQWARFGLVTLTLLLLRPLGIAAEDAPVVRIVTFGDSTTATRAGLVVYSDLLERKLNEKQSPVRVINAGIKGNTTEMAAKRFEHDVLAREPAVVIIQFGINDSAVDVWKNPPATASRVALDQYRANLRHFAETSLSRGARVVLMTPNPLLWTKPLKQMYGKPPYDPARADGFNLTLIPYTEAVRQLAAELKVPLIDIAKAHEAFARHSKEPLLLDGMHPNQRGQQLVADLLFDFILQSGVMSGSPAVPLK